MAITFPNAMKSFRYDAACNAPANFPFNPAVSSFAIDKSSIPSFDKNRLRFKMAMEFIRRSPTCQQSRRRHGDSNKTTILTTRPCGVVVLIFGIESSDFGCSCSYHECCGILVGYNAVVRFEKRVVETGENQYAVIGAARLVLDGIDQCIVGRLGSMYDNVLNHLDGRLAQVTEKFSDSTSQHKVDYNTTNNGVCSAIIIDRYVPGDGLMNALLDGVNLDSSDEEV